MDKIQPEEDTNTRTILSLTRKTLKIETMYPSFYICSNLINSSRLIHLNVTYEVTGHREISQKLCDFRTIETLPSRLSLFGEGLVYYNSRRFTRSVMTFLNVYCNNRCTVLVFRSPFGVPKIILV